MLDEPDTSLHARLATLVGATYVITHAPDMAAWLISTTGPDGDVFMAHITVAGQSMQLLNGGPQFPFTEAVSFVYPCHGQDELDMFWNALIADGGEEGNCGWLRDKFGLSWQIIPDNMGELLGNQAAMDAMFAMKKLDIAGLVSAHDSLSGEEN